MSQWIKPYTDILNDPKMVQLRGDPDERTPLVAPLS